LPEPDLYRRAKLTGLGVVLTISGTLRGTVTTRAVDAQPFFNAASPVMKILMVQELRF
jgi:hypothetical protein